MDGDWYTPTLASCRLQNPYPIYPHELLVTTENRFPDELVDLARWSVDFLTRPNPDLGRSGSVCPFAHPSMENGLYFIADTLTVSAEEEDLGELMLTAKVWHQETAEDLPEKVRSLLTLLVPTPWLAGTSSAEIDDVQRALKDEYVREGLMVGQFHPDSEERGLWNDSFRPLRTSTPLLAIRFMTASDLVFLTSSRLHLDSYLKRFATEIPSRARAALVNLAPPAA